MNIGYCLTKREQVLISDVINLATQLLGVKANGYMDGSSVRDAIKIMENMQRDAGELLTSFNAALRGTTAVPFVVEESLKSGAFPDRNQVSFVPAPEGEVGDGVTNEMG